MVHVVSFRERNGIRFELATEAPGYTVDENLDELGQRLVLPARLKPQRERVATRLPDHDIPEAAVANPEAGVDPD